MRLRALLFRETKVDTESLGLSDPLKGLSGAHSPALATSSRASNSLGESPMVQVIQPKHYAMLRRWHDNPNDFQVIEYCLSEQEAREIIHYMPKSTLWQYEVGKYE
jgi:hypothetical protein